ncbi:MAG: hypothetical protein LUE29_13810 [Lachnospiraceae bacterium]|nr:hypothetical protein [Lachnospiraceae bacterium]
MKKLKYTLSVLLMLTGFIFTAELYQNYLTNICSGKYYFSIEEKYHRDVLVETLEGAAKEQGLGIFAVTDMISTALVNEIDVYADEAARQALAEEDITAGEFTSIFSGRTFVNFHDFHEIADDASIETFYFTGGGMDEVLAVKNQVLSTFATSYVHRQEGDGRGWMIYAVWGLIYALLLLLGWMTIQYEKKEVFIRVSLGASMKQITVRNMAVDTLLFLAVWVMLRLFLGLFLSLNYRSDILGGLLALFLLTQILLHILGCRYDYREIIYGFCPRHHEKGRID